MKLRLYENDGTKPVVTEGYLFYPFKNGSSVFQIRMEALTRIIKLNPRKIDLYLPLIYGTLELVETINVCKALNIKLMLWHFDQEKDNYFPQEIIN